MGHIFKRENFPMKITRRDCLKSAAAVAALPLIGSEALAAAPSLAGASFGTFVTGTKLKKTDLAGKVIVFEYWGDRCGPCLASIGHICALQKKHGRDKVVIIANQVWTKDVGAAKKAWDSRATNKLVTVINHGSIKGVKVGGVPTSFVFAANGSYIWKGHPKGGLDAAVLKALKTA